MKELVMLTEVRIGLEVVHVLHEFNHLLLSVEYTHIVQGESKRI